MARESISVTEAGLALNIGNASDVPNVLSYECEILTKEGIELKNALDIKMDQDKFIMFAMDLKKKNYGSTFGLSLFKYKLSEDKTKNEYDFSRDFLSGI